MNQLREYTGLSDTPIKLLYREKSGRMEFDPKPDDNANTRNKGHKDKESRNKTQNRKDRKLHQVKKCKRDESSQ